MEIIYQQNPLTTKIILNEEEKTKIWYKIKEETLIQLLFSTHYEFLKHNYDITKVNIEKVKKILDPNYYIEEPIDNETTKRFQWYMEELESEHSGDCTACAYTCPKCQVENMLEIDTINGLSKDMASKINTLFTENKDLTIEQAIEILKDDHNKIPDESFINVWKDKGGWEEFIPQFKKENDNLIDWLTNYKETKLIKK